MTDPTEAVQRLLEGAAALQEDTDSRNLPDIPNKPDKTNWVEKAGGLPSYIERIAKHLRSERGMSTSHAIASAVTVVKKVCATGKPNASFKGTWNEKSQAEACAAVAQWEKMKAGSKVTEALFIVCEAVTARGPFPSLEACYELLEAVAE